MVKGILLDVDGTLVLSNTAHTHAWVDAFENFGYHVPFNKIRQLMGIGGDTLIPTLLPELADEAHLRKEISSKRKAIFLEKYIQEVLPSPGARDLVLYLKKQGMKLLVASSAHEDELEPLLKIAQVEDRLTDFTSASEVERSKPFPDIISVALEKIALKPEEVLMIGDTPFDIQAASTCQVKTIAVRTGGFADDELHDALIIVDTLCDIMQIFEQTQGFAQIF